MSFDDVHDVMIMLGNSVLGTWIEAFVRDAYHLLDPPVDVQLGDGDHIFPDIGRIGGDPRAIVMLGPGVKAMDMVERRVLPVVAIIDDPVDSVRFSMVSKPLPFLEALRLHSRYASAHYLYLHNPAVLIIERHPSASARATLVDILKHIDVTIDAEEEAALLLRFGGSTEDRWSIETALSRHVPHYCALEGARDHLTPEQVATVLEALGPLVQGALTREIPPIIWRSSVFLFGDRPNETAPAMVDAAGGARVIFFGPYFHLPPGQWEVHVLLAFSQETKGEPFRLLLYAQYEPIANVLMRPEGGGAFEGRFTVTHVRPEHHLEIHFKNDVGLIDGQVALGRMRFSRPAPLLSVREAENRPAPPVGDAAGGNPGERLRRH